MTAQYRSEKLRDIAIHDALLQINCYRNVGRLDRAIRLVVGVAMIMSVFFVGPVSAALPWAFEWWQVLPFLGMYPAVTAFLGWEPLYELLGISTSTMASDQYEQLREALRREEQRYHLVSRVSFA